MKKVRFFIFLAIILFTGSWMGQPARAIELDKGLSIEGLGFIDFSSVSGDSYQSHTGSYAISSAYADTTSGRDNGFHFTRAYLTAKAKLSDELTARITYDEKDGYSGKAFVKFVYGEYTYYPNHKTVFGLVPTPWNYYEEAFYTYRFLGPVFADVQGAQSSADLGVSLVGSFLDKLVDYHVGVYEGEGYSSSTPDGQGSAYAGRFSVNWSGLNVSLFDWTETKRNGAGDYNPTRLIGLVTYGNSFFRVAGEYLTADDQKSGTNQTAAAPVLGQTDTNLANGQFNKGTGYSLWAHTRIPGIEAFRIFVRYDYMKPDSDFDNNNKNLAALGAFKAGTNTLAKIAVSYDLSNSVIVALEDAIRTNKINNTGDSTTDNILALKAQVAF